jgi:hypothetical protein
VTIGMIQVGAELGGPATVIVPACWAPVAATGTPPIWPAIATPLPALALPLAVALPVPVPVPLPLQAASAVMPATTSASPPAIRLLIASHPFPRRYRHRSAVGSCASTLRFSLFRRRQAEPAPDAGSRRPSARTAFLACVRWFLHELNRSARRHRQIC